MIKPQMTERDRAEYNSRNGINANQIDVVVFLAKCPSCVQEKKNPCLISLCICLEYSYF